MKFNNGCWLLEEGIHSHSPVQVYYTKIEPNRVTLCAPVGRINQRGDTLNNTTLTIIITSPMQEVIRVQASHHIGFTEKSPQFELQGLDNLPIQAEETKDRIIITNGDLSLEIFEEKFTMVYRRNGKIITKSTANDLACMKTDWKGSAYDKYGDSKNTYMRQQLSIGVNELIYGMGERYTPIVKNGQTVDIWNRDSGTSTDHSYKNIPFYISNKGYGLFVNHPEEVMFEIGTEHVNKAGFSVEGGYLDYFLINGPSMKDVLVRYTDLTGKPSLPAPWTFGLWLSTSFTTNYDEETVMSFIDGMLDRGIPLRTFHFDCFWMREFAWCDFKWDNRVFPDPEGLIRRIKAKGLNISVWINSYVGQESSMFQEGVEQNYFLKRPNGDVWQWDMWQPGMAIVDFTNPAAYDWFQKKLEFLIDMGVDAFKTDFGERIPTEVVYHDGSDPKKMHNYYTYLYNKCVYEILERKLGKGKAVLFARSATVGGQKFPVHWGGDCWSDYESMEESLRGGLSLQMSGFGYWSHDIGGFESTSTADVYKRWVAFGMLSSHSRLHGSSSYRVPWLYDEEAVAVVRFFTTLKAKLMPYLYKTAVDTSITGIPTMRSMVLEFTEDRNCSYLDKQYMLGDNLLVAPIFNDENIAEYYLPEGIWTNYLTGEVTSGGRWVTETQDYLSIPLMVKENSIIALGAYEDRPDYDYADGVELRVYELVNHKKAETVVNNVNNNIDLQISIIKINNRIDIEVNSHKEFSIRLVNSYVGKVVGAEVSIDGKDSVLKSCESRITIDLSRCLD